MEGPLRTAEAKRLLRRILREGCVAYSQPHALQRLKARGLSMVDCENVLRAGVVDEAEFENGCWRYQVCTQKIVVVVEFLSKKDVLIVTAWRM